MSAGAGFSFQPNFVTEHPKPSLQASGFRLQASGFRLQASGFRLQASGLKLQNLFDKSKKMELLIGIMKVTWLYPGTNGLI
jgi:hypothetical protein